LSGRSRCRVDGAGPRIRLRSPDRAARTARAAGRPAPWAGL